MLSSDEGFKMLGHNFHCPDAVLTAICSSVDYIKTISDLNMYYLRPQCKEKFFAIICDTVRGAPPPKKRTRCK